MSESWLVPVVGELKRFYGMQPEPPDTPFGFYVWYVLGQRSTPAGRDAALAALKRVPAFTADAVRKAPRARLHAALEHAGPPEERLQAILSGAEVFRRHRDLEDRVRGPILGARRAARMLGALDRVGAQWLLLACGGHPFLPRHPGVGRVSMRLGIVPLPKPNGAVSQRRAAHTVARSLPRDAAFLEAVMVYVTHHAANTCVVKDPHCRVCPLASSCQFARIVV